MSWIKIDDPLCAQFGHQGSEPCLEDCAGGLFGFREVADKIWFVSFMDYDPGSFDEDEARVEPAENHFMAKVLTMSWV